MNYTVRIGYDETEHRYYVLSSDIPGLNIEAETFEAFIEAAQDAAPDLLQDKSGRSYIRFKRQTPISRQAAFR